MKKLCIYDASEKSLVGLSWKVAANLFRDDFHTVMPVNGVEDCLAKIDALQVAGEVFDEVQVWSHGTYGYVIFNGSAMSHHFWKSLSAIMASMTSTVWLRVCSFAATPKGKRACETASQLLRCRLVAHTHLIGTWACHSGAQGLRPGDKATWADTEGVTSKGHPLSSSPFQANTVPAWEMTVPYWLFRPRPPALTLLSGP